MDLVNKEKLYARLNEFASLFTNESDAQVSLVKIVDSRSPLLPLENLEEDLSYLTDVALAYPVRDQVKVLESLGKIYSESQIAKTGRIKRFLQKQIKPEKYISPAEQLFGRVINFKNHVGNFPISRLEVIARDHFFDESYINIPGSEWSLVERQRYGCMRTNS